MSDALPGPAGPRTMTLFLGQGGLMAVTLDPTGDNLPRPQGPWRKVGVIQTFDASVYRTIESRGYWLMESAGTKADGPDHLPPQHPTLQ